MEQKTEALYLINRDRFLHLRENDAGVGFATYDCATGEPQEFGQISKQNLPPDGQNAIPAARNWYLFELSSDDRKAIQEVSLQHLDLQLLRSGQYPEIPGFFVIWACGAATERFDLSGASALRH